MIKELAVGGSIGAVAVAPMTAAGAGKRENKIMSPNHKVGDPVATAKYAMIISLRRKSRIGVNKYPAEDGVRKKLYIRKQNLTIIERQVGKNHMQK